MPMKVCLLLLSFLAGFLVLTISVAQTNNLDRARTVWENLYYHGRFFGMSKSQSREAADKFLVDFRLVERINLVLCHLVQHPDIALL